MQTLRKKLSSRKFWALLADLVICILVLFGVDSAAQVQVAALIAAAGGAAVYILAEAAVDKACAAMEEGQSPDNTDPGMN